MAGSRPAATGRVLVLLGLLTAFGPLSFDMYLPALPALTTELSPSDPTVQLTLSLCMVGMGLGQLFAGPISDRTGRRLPLLVGVALFTAGVLGSAFAPNMTVLLVMRLLTGIGGGVGVVLARSMVRDLYSGLEAARAFAVISMVFGVAPVLAPLIGGQLLTFTSWRGIFIALALIGAALFVAGLTLRETLPPAARHDGGLASTLRVFRGLLGNREFMVGALLLGLAQTPLNLYLAMSSLVLQRHYGLSAQAYGWVFAVNAVGIVVAGRVVMTLVGRHGPLRLLVAAVLLSVLDMAALAVGVLVFDSLPVVLVTLVVLLFCVGVIMPTATTVALAGQGHVVGSASSLLGLIAFTLAAAVPPLVALFGVTAQVWAVAMLLGGLAALLPLSALRRHP